MLCFHLLADYAKKVVPCHWSGRFPIAFVSLSITFSLAGCETLRLDNDAQSIDEVIIPELRGVLLQSGQPASGVRLRVSQREGEQSVCEIPLAQTNAGSDGDFLFPVVNSDLSGAVFDRVSNNWQICIAKDDLAGQQAADPATATEWLQIWYDSHAGVMFGEKYTELTCDLDKIPRDDGRKKSFLSRLRQPPAICVVKAKA